MKILDLTGQRFGLLTVLSRAHNSPQGGSQWNCVCDCGATKVVRGAAMTSGNSTSCGSHHRRKPRRDVVGIRAAHNRIVAKRGRASDQTCVDCGGRARDWSYTESDPQPLLSPTGARYSLDVFRYVPRCRTCHKRHDLNFGINSDAGLQEQENRKEPA